MSRLARLVLCVSLLAAVGRTQTQLATFALPGPFGEVGQEIGVAGDFDGDGVTDLLAAGPAVLAVYSGDTGAELAAVPLFPGIPGKIPTGLLGVPDIDGDGLRDVVLADGASIRAVSTADGDVLWSLAGSLFGSLGQSLALLDDQDGDLFPDVVVGDPSATPGGLSAAGSIFVLSGDSGALIHRIDGTAALQQMGLGLDAGSDYDGDGRRDLLVGDTQFKVGINTTGRLLVLRAIDGGLIDAIVNDTSTSNFGRMVANTGDVTGDGFLDVAVTTAESGTAVEAFSTETGLELWQDNVAPQAMVSVGDGDGDGIPGFVTGIPSFFFNSTARILHGLDGHLIFTLTQPGGATYADLVAPGDTDGDGKVELLASSGGVEPYFPEDPAGLHQELPTGAVLHTLTHPAGGQALGTVVDAAGDVDADGVGDWLVASSERAVVFSGDDGTALLDVESGMQLVGTFAVQSAGCGLGDVNGDGVPDFVIANGQFSVPSGNSDGRVMVFSGADGSVLVQRDGPFDVGNGFGSYLADTTDHDGDGVRDLYVAAPFTDVNGFSDAGEVLLVSGDTLQTLATLHGLPQTSGDFGTVLNADGDITGDGVPELAVGSSDDWPGQFNAGSLYILDGATHATLFRKDGGPSAYFIHGAITGDLNGDDVADFVSAEPQYPVPGEPQPRGRVRAWSGATGALFWERLGPWTLSSYGRSVCGAGDVNGDGYADVGATATPQSTGANTGTFALLSGLDGSVLDQMVIEGSNSATLGQIRTAGFVDEGGCAEIILGVPPYLGQGAAYAFASSKGGVHGFVDLGSAKPGSNGKAPSLRGYGDLAANQLVTLRARHALPSKSCTWFVGLGAGYVPFKKGVLVPDPFGLYFAIPLLTDVSGEVSISAPNPPAVFEGLTLYHQFWFSDPAASAKVSASNGMAEIFK